MLSVEGRREVEVDGVAAVVEVANPESPENSSVRQNDVRVLYHEPLSRLMPNPLSPPRLHRHGVVEVNLRKLPVASLLDEAVHPKHLYTPLGGIVIYESGKAYHNDHAVVYVRLGSLFGVLVEHTDGLDHPRCQC